MWAIVTSFYMQFSAMYPPSSSDNESEEDIDAESLSAKLQDESLENNTSV